MGCTFSSPALQNGGSYYVNSVGPAAGNAFGLPAQFDDGFFTCGGPILTPVVTQTLSEASTLYTCKPFHAGYDASILCPSLPRSSLTGAFELHFTVAPANAEPFQTGGSAYFTVFNEADAFVTQDVTYTISDVATFTGGVSTVTETVTKDPDVDSTTIVVTSYGRTRRVDVPVTSTVTSVVTKTTSVKSCPKIRRIRAREFVPSPQPANALRKRDSGYGAFDGALSFDSTATIYSSTVYETSYYGTITVGGSTETATATVDGEGGETVTATVTTRVHDATTEYTTISKTKTEKSTTTITNYPTTCRTVI